MSRRQWKNPSLFPNKLKRHQSREIRREKSGHPLAEIGGAAAAKFDPNAPVDLRTHRCSESERKESGGAG